MFDLYKRTSIGDVITYVRPFQTVSTGALNQCNTMAISEEMVVILPDASTLIIPLATAELQATITDPSQSFNVVDPTTGMIIGSTNFAQLKVQMYSLYLYLASIRDAEEAEQLS